ncbi:hypothetical protein ANO11243_092210 [Dothideomycetidae sp. 11243]|nr:hypothetical protein ANO11243_092210 [fungal sp. No.11243]
MPSRRKGAPPSPFTFVSYHAAQEECSRSSSTSRVIRSHAAYWGGQTGRSRKGSRGRTAIEDGTVSPARSHKRRAIVDVRSLGSEAIGQQSAHESLYPANSILKENGLLADTEPLLQDDFLLQDDLDLFNGETLLTMEGRRTSFADAQRESQPEPDPEPEVLSEESPETASAQGVLDPRFERIDSHDAMDVSSYQSDGYLQLPELSDSATSAYFGLPFLETFFRPGEADRATFAKGCELVSLAHTMAVTGIDRMPELLRLKSEILQSVAAKLDSGIDSLNPHIFGAMLMLGLPSVCLTSQDLPNGMSLAEYIAACASDDAVCSSRSAEAASSSLKERLVHWEKLRGLLRGFAVADRRGLLCPLIRYIRRSIDL